MPYLREDKCVFKKNSDGSKGKSMGCSDTEEEAKAHMKALYANENKSYAEFSMVITKASIPDKSSRTMRISMVNSDTSEDSYEEKMSVELFEDFVERIEKSLDVPEPFDGVLNDGKWKGGMPYLSVSHYKSGNGKNVPGDVEKIYVDGEKLKSSAVLSENRLGLAVWKAINKDLEDRNKPLEERAFENPVRISIGFLDLEHKHEIEGEDDYIFTRTALKQKCEKCEEGINGKVYLKGQLVHLAFTRVPANPRTHVEVMKMGDEIQTKKDDARSIIGDELADELVGKSVVKDDDALVIKAKDEKDYREYATKVEMAFSDEFTPPEQPRMYVSTVKEKTLVVVEYDPNKEYPESSKIYKLGYKDDGDGNFTFDKRSDWEEMEYGLMPKKSEATDEGWEVEFKNEPQVEKSAVEDKLEAIMDEPTVQEVPVVEEEQVVEEENKEEPVEAAHVEEPAELDKSAAAVVAKIKELAAQGKYGADALKEVRPLFNQFGETVKKSVSAPAGQIDEDALAERVVNRIMEALPALIAKSVPAAPEQGAAYTNPFIPRSLTGVTQQVKVAQEGQKKLTQIEKIARQHTGLPTE